MEIDKAISFFITSLKYEQLSPHTIRAYQQDLIQWMRVMDKLDLDMLNFEDFEVYFMMLQEESLKVTSLRRKRVVIHRFLKFCYDKKFCVERLFDFISPIKTKRVNAPKEILTKKEIDQLKTYLAKEIGNTKELISNTYYNYLYYCAVRNELMIYILLYTGVRAAELVQIKKKDFDKENNTLTILAKGHKYNTIPLHQELIEAFLNYDNHLAIVAETEEVKQYIESDYLFPSRLNPMKHLTTRTLYDLMEKLSTIIGRHIHAHLFRHTFASYCIAANMDIATLSALVSHSNPSITLSIYTHEIQGNQKREEMKKLNFNF